MTVDIDAVLADNDTAIGQAITPAVTAREGINLNAALDQFRNGEITREQAEAAGLAFHRAPSLNDDPRLASALAAVARRTLGMAAAATPSRRIA